MEKKLNDGNHGQCQKYPKHPKIYTAICPNGPKVWDIVEKRLPTRIPPKKLLNLTIEKPCEISLGKKVIRS